MDTKNNEVNQLQRRISSYAMIAAVVLAAVFFLFHEKAIAKGLLLGTCFSIINFGLMARSIPFTLGQSRPKASFIGFTSIIFRYTVLAIPLVVAVKSVSFNFVAVVIGIFAVQIVTLVDYIIIRPIWEGK